MKFKDLKATLKNGVSPVYLIEGADAYLRESAFNSILSAAITNVEFNLDEFSGQDVKIRPDEIYAAFLSYPFLSDKRLVKINEFYPTASDLKGAMLKKLLNEENDTTVLVIVNEKACAALKKQPRVTLVDCGRLDDALIAKWIMKRALLSKTAIDQSAANLLIEYTLGDMTRVSTETEKLIAYAGENGVIDEKAVEAVAIKDVDYEVYELTECIALKNSGKAFEILKAMFDKNEDKQRLFTAIFYHIRRLFYSSISAASTAELASTLGVHEYAVIKAKQQAKRFKVKRLKRIMDKFQELDADFKSGEITVNDALFNSIFEILTEE